MNWLEDVKGRCTEYAAEPPPPHLRLIQERESRYRSQASQERVIRQSAIPTRYFDASLGNLEVDCYNRDAVAAAAEIVESRFVMGIGLFGHVAGVGKSYVAAAIANAAIERGIAAKMFTPEALLGRIFEASTYGGDEAIASVMRDIAMTPVLVLDDLGSEALSRQKLAWLYEVLNARWNAGKGRCLIATSNMSFQSLHERYGTIAEKAGDPERAEAIMDRVRALAWPWFEISGVSRRGAA